MDFEFFEKLSSEEANAFLRRFLQVESSHIKETMKQCADDGIRMDFSIKSITPFMRWVLEKLTTIPKELDTAVPKWIQNTESYTKHLFDFDEPSGILILRAAYYLGQSFVRSYHNLHWDIGGPKTMKANMPVVAGFEHDLELAPILVAENIFSRIIDDPKKIGDIRTAVNKWNGYVR